MFDKVNISPLALTILAFLSRSPGKQYYLREITRITGASVGGCHKVLGELYKMRFVEKNKSGKNLYYKTNENHPAIKFFKVFVSLKEINTFIEKIKIDCNKIILFGSCSTGDDTSESDIDLLVLTENPTKLKRQMKGKKINGRELKPIIISPHNFIKMKNQNPALYKEITKGIELWREEYE
jgi:predicted nucleotidyltransferase